MYPFERFSQPSKAVLTLAQQEAERAKHTYIGTEHILLGLLLGEGNAGRILASLNVSYDETRTAVETLVGNNEHIVIQQIIPTSRVKKVIEMAFEEARRLGLPLVSTEHLLIAVLSEGEGIAAKVLQDQCVSLDTVREEAADLLASGVIEEASYLPSSPVTDRMPVDVVRAVLRHADQADIITAMLNDPDSTLSRALATLGLTANTTYLRARLLR